MSRKNSRDKKSVYKHQKRPIISVYKHFFNLIHVLFVANSHKKVFTNTKNSYQGTSLTSLTARPYCLFPYMMKRPKSCKER